MLPADAYALGAELARRHRSEGRDPSTVTNEQIEDELADLAGAALPDLLASMQLTHWAVRGYFSVGQENH